MKKYLLILLFIMCGCSGTQKPVEPVKPIEPETWHCYADINHDSNCVEIDVKDINDVCKTGDYRILKINPSKLIFVYSMRPKTDIKKCLETGKAKQ